MVKIVDVGSIGSYFESLSDPRHTRNRKHSMVDIAVIAVCGVICGCDGPTAIHRWARQRTSWLAQYLALPNGIPSRDCIRRLLMALRPEAFQRCFRAWICDAIPADPQGTLPTRRHRRQGLSRVARRGQGPPRDDRVVVVAREDLRAFPDQLGDVGIARTAAEGVGAVGVAEFVRDRLGDPAGRELAARAVEAIGQGMRRPRTPGDTTEHVAVGPAWRRHRDREPPAAAGREGRCSGAGRGGHRPVLCRSGGSMIRVESRSLVPDQSSPRSSPGRAPRKPGEVEQPGARSSCHPGTPAAASATARSRAAGIGGVRPGSLSDLTAVAGGRDRRAQGLPGSSRLGVRPATGPAAPVEHRPDRPDELAAGVLPRLGPGAEDFGVDELQLRARQIGHPGQVPEMAGLDLQAQVSAPRAFLRDVLFADLESQELPPGRSPSGGSRRTGPFLRPSRLRPIARPPSRRRGRCCRGRTSGVSTCSA